MTKFGCFAVLLKVRPVPDSTFVPSVCPHDCPSTCALEVEKLASDRIGKVRGAAANSYTDGVICAKVVPLRRAGPPS